MTVTVNAGHIQLFSATPNSPVRWRLLSGNNRDAGRGTESYPDAESCRIGVKQLQAAISELEPSLRRTALNEWVWQVSLRGQVVAVSGRGFDRLIRCEQGLRQFVLHIRDAEIGSTLMVTNARRW
jgi:hypothetical protein